MKFLTQILFVTFLFGVGCKTVDQTQNLPQSLSYNQQKAFDKVFFDASKQKILNNQEKALTLYSEALRLNSSCHACMYELSVLNYEQKNYLLLKKEKNLKIMKPHYQLQGLMFLDLSSYFFLFFINLILMMNLFHYTQNLNILYSYRQNTDKTPTKHRQTWHLSRSHRRC